MLEPTHDKQQSSIPWANKPAAN